MGAVALTCSWLQSRPPRQRLGQELPAGYTPDTRQFHGAET
jgi:hypothetical protein